MRIALIVHDFSRSLGHGRYTVELASRFRHDHEVHVFANTASEPEIDGVRVHHVPALRVNALSTIVTFLLPATLLAGSRWDIIHAQGASCLRFNVITAHICNAGWARAQQHAVVARGWRQRTMERTVIPLEWALYTRRPGAEVIAISRQLRQELATFYGRHDRVEVIHHGVDTELFSPAARMRHRSSIRAELGVAPDQFIALFVGDLRKGATVAIDAAARAPGARILFVSRSDARPFAEHARVAGVMDRTIFHGPTDRIERYYAAADAFLFPTPYDAFGMVVSEAMASGVPVITSRQAGASELIDDGVSGFVVDDPTDSAAFATRLRALVADRALAESMGQAGRAVAERHRWDDVARRTMQVYERASPLA